MWFLDVYRIHAQPFDNQQVLSEHLGPLVVFVRDILLHGRGEGDGVAAAERDEEDVSVYFCLAEFSLIGSGKGGRGAGSGERGRSIFNTKRGGGDLRRHDIIILFLLAWCKFICKLIRNGR